MYFALLRQASGSTQEGLCVANTVASCLESSLNKPLGTEGFFVSKYVSMALEDLFCGSISHGETLSGIATDESLFNFT
jgi:hypothetical protein